MYPILHAQGLFSKVPVAEITYDASLREKTTFRIGGKTKAFFTPRSISSLVKVYQRCLEYEIPIYILGGGSNLLITRDLEGVVLSLKHLRKIELEQHHFVRAQCGASLNALIQFAEQRNLGGMEKLVGIPGTVGGALSINAGGKYANIGKSVFLVHVLEKEGSLRWKTQEECQFEYRNSGLRNEVILEVILQLQPNVERAQLRESKISVMQEKCQTQPLSAYSAGCVFKNPPGHSAGRLIDQAGFKGHMVGDAIVSACHANFILNRGQATAEDVLQLMDQIRNRVEHQTQIVLQPEICFWN
ncbi:MAG: UDP-N-acetylmuramate dehydrogenase [Planctomycetota bacterium]